MQHGIELACAGIAIQRVVAGTARERVVALMSAEAIVAVLAEQEIGATPCGEPVVAIAAVQCVVARARWIVDAGCGRELPKPPLDVIPETPLYVSGDDIGITHDLVVAGAAENQIPPGPAG